MKRLLVILLLGVSLGTLTALPPSEMTTEELLIDSLIELNKVKKTLGELLVSRERLKTELENSNEKSSEEIRSLQDSLETLEADLRIVSAELIEYKTISANLERELQKANERTKWWRRGTALLGGIILIGGTYNALYD